MVTHILQRSGSVSLDVPAEPATQVTAKHQPWDGNKRKILLVRIAGTGKEPTNSSVCNISFPDLLKAASKAEKWDLTPSLGRGFILQGHLPMWLQTAPGKVHYMPPSYYRTHIRSHKTLTNTYFYGLNVSTKVLLWWQAIKLCNNLPKEISEIFASESSPSRSWNGESLWNELLVSELEKWPTPCHTRTPMARQDLSHHLLLFFCHCHRTAPLTQPCWMAEGKDCHIWHIKTQHFQFAQNFNTVHLRPAWFCCNSKKNKVLRFPVV